MSEQENKMEQKPSHWTDEQWRAIIEKGDNLLVAAAAGSGKTSVLVERIIRRISDVNNAVGVDQLLVVTFTNAAAAEMRHRIGDALRQALESDPTSAHLRKQLVLLQRATITTLHSFCLGLLRQYYFMVELDPGFRIADQMEAELLRQDVLEEQFEQWYESDESFAALADVMVESQDDEALMGLFMRLFDFSQSHPHPERWLKDAADMFANTQVEELHESPWVVTLSGAISLELSALESQVKKAIALAEEPDGPGAYIPLLQQELSLINQAKCAAEQGWNQLDDSMRSITFGRLPAVKDADPLIKEQIQKLRNGAKDKIKKLLEEYFTMTPEQYTADLQRMAPYMQTLARLVSEFKQAFRQAKQERALVDFSDLEHLALRILQQEQEDGSFVPSAIAMQLQEQFAEVLVDEYQDINLVQETILQLVSRKETAEVAANRFMVGDVKQSIYRFRLAEPNLFMQKYDSYETNQEKDPFAPKEQDAPLELKGKRIDLAANFRSRKEVVDAVNYIFRLVMTPRVGEITYDQAAELIGRASYPEIEPEQLAVEVHLIDRTGFESEESNSGQVSERTSTNSIGSIDSYDTEVEALPTLEEEASVAQLEARLIAKRIKEWLEPGVGGQPLLVFDKKTQGMRPLEYRDIVILLRATAGWGQAIADECKQAGIPIYVEQNQGYFSANEVDIIMSLLRVIDNPKQDIPLTAVLRSPLIGLSEEDLALIRVLTPTGPFYQAVEQYVMAEEEQLNRVVMAKLRRFYRMVQGWRTRGRRSSVAELLSDIYTETGYVDYVASLENGSQRQANLRALYDRAKQYEATSYRGLFRFLRFIDRMQEQENDLGEARTITESENVVRLMTIHKSKGLEFPVVFVAGMGKQFNQSDMKGRFLLHKDLGFGPQVADAVLRLRYPSLAFLGIRQKLKLEMLAEEMRVLYVALTRAREKLILVGSAKDLSKSAIAWCSQSTDKETLSDEDLVQAKGYLDWIGRALVRHKNGEPLRLLCPDTQDNSSIPLVRDPSVWQFQFYQPSDLIAITEQSEHDEEVFSLLQKRKPVPDHPHSEEWRDKIRSVLEWQYAPQVVSQVPAKWSVSQLKSQAVNLTEGVGEDGVKIDWENDRLETHSQSVSGLESQTDMQSPTRSVAEGYSHLNPNLEKIAESPNSHRSRLTKKPRFLADMDKNREEINSEIDDIKIMTSSDPATSKVEKRGKLENKTRDEKPIFTKAEVGTFTHLIMQNVELNRALDQANVTDQIEQMIARQMLTREQASVVDIASITRFFASDLGQRMQKATKVYRELPFTLAVPLRDIRSRLLADQTELLLTDSGDERVLVQGVIDCVIREENGGLTLIDYKTDRLPPNENEAVQLLRTRYNEQISLYTRALEESWKEPVTKRYLVAMAMGLAVPLHEE
ncbi:helicase-exonuclease AddAB subunit AddA [Brevibacillus laterosporus]|uniref:helicase-exonuclease AddAB subunit AddA n=1 Tax=Brevibacillus laterosporus TaxID=1465 RepID=UPI001EF26DA6|nr:helicase-exonuclease AddAB subunit AddA [Brevibacillus laterosporus]MCG7319162.1 helicase-exonuclease AddAB subunit AddA [Brevibacillus laterosporus]